MAETRRDVRLALESFAAREVLVGRTRVCELHLDSTSDGVRVTGTVSTHGLARRLFEYLRDIPSVDRDSSSVRVLEDIGTAGTVSDESTPVRSAPDTDAEQVTEVLYGCAVTVYDAKEEWRRISAPDGYTGWVRDASLTAPDDIEPDAILRENVGADVLASADPDSERGFEFLPIGTPCQVRDGGGGTVDARFRTGMEASLPGEAISRHEGLPEAGDVVEVARQFAGTTYEWGGMTTKGIDCSGLVWVSYGVFGVDLPRDSDLQRQVGESVPRDQLQPGDLLFFPGHVAISLGGTRYVHAHGSSGGVVENSFDPADADYLPELDERLTCCRRLLSSTR